MERRTFGVGLFALLLRTLAVGRRQHPESIRVAFDMEYNGLTSFFYVCLSVFLLVKCGITCLLRMSLQQVTFFVVAFDDFVVVDGPYTRQFSLFYNTYWYYIHLGKIPDN